MPHYVKGRKGRFQTQPIWDGFDNPRHVSQWLTKTSRKDPIWIKHFKDRASVYKNEEGRLFLHPRTLRKIATKNPNRLAGDVLSELKQHHKGEKIGGGIMEALHWFGSEASNILGVNAFKEWVGLGYDHRDIPNEAQIFAKAVDMTYLDKSKRPSEVDGLKRLPRYDTDRYSVWLEPNGQYLVTVHGTKMNLSDIGQDMGIAAGFKMNNKELQGLFQQFDRDNKAYDIASHSLATQYVTNSKHNNADKIYLFNPASSPLMNSNYLNDIANNPAYTYFINPSDAVSEAVFQKMNHETMDHSYIAPYTYSPAASHSLTQWYTDLDKAKIDEPLTKVHSKGEIMED